MLETKQVLRSEESRAQCLTGPWKRRAQSPVPSCSGTKWAGLDTISWPQQEHKKGSGTREVSWSPGSEPAHSSSCFILFIQENHKTESKDLQGPQGRAGTQVEGKNCGQYCALGQCLCW
ncbi:unnamed protein product [Rangifer tarandus platyrhynchus]|uniref:Uncharacterized protein n=1 Tax=Rangifer tarandus platyrhynchus TaxID=3082113 RepID=A0AC59YGZ6_RANTA